jgi:hypothetical protein
MSCASIQKATFHNAQYHPAPEVLELGAERAKIACSDASASEGENCTASTGSRKNIVFADGTEQEPVFSQPKGSDNGAECLELLQHTQESRSANAGRKTTSNTWLQRMTCVLVSSSSEYLVNAHCE